MKVAAYQAPLLPVGSMAALDLLPAVLRRCEHERVDLLVCPEALLGGLADDHPAPDEIALERAQLERLLRPIASPAVTAVIGFTERAAGRLCNAAAVVLGGRVTGLYRKRHPARRTSVYSAGTESPLFDAGPLSFGVMICNDTNDPQLATALRLAGAHLLAVPSNNSLRPDRADVVEATRAADVANAHLTGLPVVRADVAGRLPDRIAYGTSAIITGEGAVIHAGTPFAEELLIAELG